MAETVLINSMVLLCLLFWGAWGIFDKKALSQTAPVGQLVAVYCASPLLALILVGVLTIWVPGWHLTGHTLFYALLGSISYFVATIGYLVAMTKGEASLILGVTASYPLIAQVLAFLMLGEELNLVRLVGCVVMIAGIIVISASGSSEKEQIPALKPPDLNALPTAKQNATSNWQAEQKSIAASLNRSISNAISTDSNSTAPLNAVVARGSSSIAMLELASTGPVALQQDRTSTAIDPEKEDLHRAILEGNNNFEQPYIPKEAEPSSGKPSALPTKMSLVCTICVLIAVSGWALRGIFDKIAVDHPAHPFEVYLGKFICDSVLGIGAFIWLLKNRPEVNVFSKTLRPWATGSAICLAGGSAAYYIALSKLSASYVIAITGCYPLFMYLLAVCILKEKFNMVRAIGIALITAGGVITQLTQG